MSYIHITSYSFILYSIWYCILIVIIQPDGYGFPCRFSQMPFVFSCLRFGIWDLGNPQPLKIGGKDPTYQLPICQELTVSFSGRLSQHIWKTPKFSHGVDTNIHNSPNSPNFFILKVQRTFNLMICRDRGDVPALRYWWLRGSGLPR